MGRTGCPGNPGVLVSEKTNVISFFAKREKKEEDEKPAEGETFEQAMERNRKNAERVAKERANANKSVLRSYRIRT
jgi:hypothetical protein